MNKQKKTYVKPGIVFEDFKTGELRGTTEMVKQYSTAVHKETAERVCPYEDRSFPCTVRSGK